MPSAMGDTLEYRNHHANAYIFFQKKEVFTHLSFSGIGNLSLTQRREASMQTPTDYRSFLTKTLDKKDDGQKTSMPGKRIKNSVPAIHVPAIHFFSDI